MKDIYRTIENLNALFHRYEVWVHGEYVAHDPSGVPHRKIGARKVKAFHKATGATNFINYQTSIADFMEATNGKAE